VSQRTGIARSTLSKIENDQVSPTFSVVQKLISGLNIDLPQLFTPPKRERYTMGRRDLTRKGKGQLHPTPTYEHELLGHQLAQKRMIPFKTIDFEYFCIVYPMILKKLDRNWTGFPVFSY